MRDFFNIENASDSLYRAIGSADDRSVADRVRQIWTRVEPYLDRQRPEMAARAFSATFWEMSLVATFLDLSISVTSRDQRRTKNGGPDVELQGPIWVEAITPTAGKTEDRVPAIDFEIAVKEGGVRYWVPDRELLLRIQAAIEEKINKYYDFTRKGSVALREPYVIAVSGSALPSGRFDDDLPRIVRVAFGLGEPTITYDLEQSQVIGESRPPLHSIPLRSREVPLGLLLREENAFISALLWSSSDALNPPLSPGRDWVVVHNPNATTRLPLGWIREGREYWVVAEQLLQQEWFRQRDPAG